MSDSEKLTPVERYLRHLDSIFQTEPDFYENKSLARELPGVTSKFVSHPPVTDKRRSWSGEFDLPKVLIPH